MKLVALLLCLLATNNTLYTQSVTVWTVSEDGLVITTDNRGNIWEFYADGYSPDDELTLVIDSCGTISVWDDIIVDIME